MGCGSDLGSYSGPKLCSPEYEGAGVQPPMSAGLRYCGYFSSGFDNTPSLVRPNIDVQNTPGHGRAYQPAWINGNELTKLRSVALRYEGAPRRERFFQSRLPFEAQGSAFEELGGIPKRISPLCPMERSIAITPSDEPYGIGDIVGISRDAMKESWRR